VSKWVKLLIIVIILGIISYFLWPKRVINPLADVQFRQKSLEKYDFDALVKRQGVASEIKISDKIIDKKGREIRFMSDGKWISGMMNYHPEKSSLSPVIIMIRGYAEKEGYYPGSGTWKVADELAKNGYATISLDFLGYGNSEADSPDVLEARFHKVIEVLDLIQSVKQLSWVDKDKIGIWAHSNGGQIALSVLEISGEKYPTVLWAPMTLPFPQSLIDTADEGEDKQKAIDFVNKFQKYYDSRRYAFENYYEWINAPILIQQGTADSQVKVEWQQSLQSRLKEFGKKSELIIYNGADHNMKGSWNDVVKRDIEWYRFMM